MVTTKKSPPKAPPMPLESLSLKKWYTEQADRFMSRKRVFTHPVTGKQYTYKKISGLMYSISLLWDRLTGKSIIPIIYETPEILIANHHQFFLKSRESRQSLDMLFGLENLMRIEVDNKKTELAHFYIMVKTPLKKQYGFKVSLIKL